MRVRPFFVCTHVAPPTIRIGLFNLACRATRFVVGLNLYREKTVAQDLGAKIRARLARARRLLRHGGGRTRGQQFSVAPASQPALAVLPAKNAGNTARAHRFLHSSGTVYAQRFSFAQSVGARCGEQAFVESDSPHHIDRMPGCLNKGNQPSLTSIKICARKIVDFPLITRYLFKGTGYKNQLLPVPSG